MRVLAKCEDHGWYSVVLFGLKRTTMPECPRCKSQREGLEQFKKDIRKILSKGVQQ
jgi:hypothetical protein